MKILGFPLLAVGLLYASTPADLYQTAMRQTEQGKLADARTTLHSLVDAYPQDPLALQATGAIDATLLYDEGQTRAKAGRYQTARLAFETLIAVYPENPLAKRAQSALDAMKEKLGGRVVQSLEFRDMQAMPADEMQAALEAREVRLAVGCLCRSKDVEQAKVAIEEILADKGMTHVRIEAQTKTIRPDAVAVVFSVEKPHGSLLRPWRMLHRKTDTQTTGI